MTAHVLVVDDHRELRETLALILRDEGYDVTTAMNGFQALDRVSERCPDLVLTDVDMPGMSGGELCRRLHDTASEVKVVLMSAGRSPRDADGSGRAIAYLDKPFDIDTLLAALSGALMRNAA